MIDHESDRQLSQMLDELGPAGPPAGFTRNVMARIRNNHITIHRSHSLSNRKGTAMTRKAMWGLAAAAAILLAIFVVRGFPPAGQGTESTIGAAQRYQAPQIADSDVVLGDAAVQEFIQSDTFERAINDPDVRALLADARVYAALQQADFRRDLLDAEVRDSLARAELLQAFSNPDVRRALDSQELRNQYDAELKKAMAALQAAEARGGVVTAARANPRDTQVMWYKASEAAMRAAVASEAVSRAVDAGARRQVVENSAALAALADPGMRKAIDSAAVRTFLADDGRRALMARPDMAAALSNRAFADALAHEAFASAVASQSFQNRLSAR